MSALAMILAAGMMLGDGPGRVSGEVEQGLDLRGEWEGILVWAGRPRPVVLSDSSLWWGKKRSWVIWNVSDLADEGSGRFRFKWVQYPTLGIYKLSGDTIFMCSCDASKGWPTSFRPGKGKEVYILYRVKPRK